MTISYNDFLIPTILLLTWIGYALIEGIQEGYFYDYRNIASPTKKQNLHWMPFLERGIVIVLIGFLNYTQEDTLFPMLKNGIFIFSLMLIFSFFHNGIYYLTRNKLDKNIYPKKWFENSATSEATIELSFISRTLMAITGLLGVITSIGL